MDAKILGNYIAARRKELGMTQANLADVTKSISVFKMQKNW